MKTFSNFGEIDASHGLLFDITLVNEFSSNVIQTYRMTPEW